MNKPSNSYPNRVPNTQDALEQEAYDWDVANYEWYLERDAWDDDDNNAFNQNVDQYNEFAAYVFFGQVPFEDVPSDIEF